MLMVLSAIIKKFKNMFKIFYYYNPVVKQYDFDVRDVNLKPEYRRYYVDYFCSNGRKSFWAGRFNGDTPTEALKAVRDMVDKLNQPRPLFGKNGRIAQWFWFIS
jgi:hypothetical protein